MNIDQALVLGLVQGLTEFLPVSSSGHLALAQYWLGLQEPGLFFEVFLHAASLVAIIIFFWPDIKKLKFKDYQWLGLATIPAIVAGLLGQELVDLVVAVPLLVGAFLLLTGFINLFIQKFMDKPIVKTNELTPTKSLMIGLFQAVAIIPGISRSGATLLGSLSQGLDRQKAFAFTFLLAIPAILGASAWQMLKLFTEHHALPAGTILLAGGLGTLVTSLLSLKILKKLISQARFTFFSWYCFLLGGGVILVQLMR
ncbi:MAG: undecaprenyl-diphosphate phosphatase [Candidatus Paceibacterota bacterium]